MCSGKIAAVSVPTDNFKASANEQRKSYILQLNVTVSTNYSELTNITNGIEGKQIIWFINFIPYPNIVFFVKYHC